VGVLESERRWPDDDIPKTSGDVRKFAVSRVPKCTMGWEMWGPSVSTDTRFRPCRNRLGNGILTRQSQNHGFDSRPRLIDFGTNDLRIKQFEIVSESE
jgi:hypothetical protein